MKQNIEKSLALLGFVVIMLLTSSCGSKHKKTEPQTVVTAPIMVYAAASLTDVLSEIIDSFEVRYPVKVQTNMASSGTLARQIEQGGMPDVYISASQKWVDYVDSIGYIRDNTKTAIAQNDLVLIAPLSNTLELSLIDSSLHFVALLGQDRLSMGDPAHVPAGKYAKQSLDYYGWYGQLKGKILPAKDVRSALMVVEMEEAPLGIVYRTDAQKSAKVKILSAFSDESHKPIVYVGGMCNDNPMATIFFEYLNAEATKAIWFKYGFRK